MDKAEQQNLTVWSVKVSKQLEQELYELARLERRSFREAAIYFLEVMLALCVNKRRFRLKFAAEEGSGSMSGHIKIQMSIELQDRLFHKAGEYGLKGSELVRLFLRIALDFHQTLVPENQVVSKEDFLKLIVESFEEKTRLVQ